MPWGISSEISKSWGFCLDQVVLTCLDTPLFCLAKQEHVQWATILYVLPGVKMHPKCIHCNVLEYQNPTTNAFYHTHLVVPPQGDLCNSLRGSCACPYCLKQNFEYFEIASILQLATYRTPSGTYTSCFVQKKHRALYQSKKTEQAD